MSKIIRRAPQVQDYEEEYEEDYASDNNDNNNDNSNDNDNNNDYSFNVARDQADYDTVDDDLQEPEYREFDEGAQAKLEKLCSSYVIMIDKLKKVKETGKKLKSVTDAYMEEIESMLNVHRIKEYSHGELKFYIDSVQKKKQLKKDDMKKAIEEVVHDKRTIDEIYKEFEHRTQVVDKTQVKCSKRGKK